MISAVRGKIVSRTGDRVVLATAGGVSYEIAVPLGVLERLPEDGATVELATVLVVREDGWALYGFDRELERAVFQRLLGASGVGPRHAMALVSTLGGERVVRALREGDLATLCTVPGIGKKTAERMVVELKDRVRDLSEGEGEPARPASAEQAVQALVGLGYGAAEADRVVRAVVNREGPAEAVELIRRALQHLSGA
ncbi:Holliday junction ATP-dependent DNA helicase RuvA [bacterium HR33]|nr:Holliday junction ATP-dependent DNA helicase RuvA [bacterium HR33]